MPELPDVEVFRRYVNSTSLHQNIELVEVRNGKILGGVSALKLQSTLKGRRFESTRRHGKNLFVGLDGGGWLLMHFGMTGRLKYFKDMDQDPPHDRFLISFENRYHLASIASGCSARWILSNIWRRSYGRSSRALTFWNWTWPLSGSVSRGERAR
jgi:formamidopyrimidine-DNA glycosylase